MGLPFVVTTDQGSEFRNHLNEELMNVFGIQHRLTTPYHPQANGLDERLNQTVVNTLAKFAQENRETWDAKLQEVVYAYNTAVQESTKHTPFEAMFGRVGRLPVDFNANPAYNAEVNCRNSKMLKARIALNVPKNAKELKMLSEKTSSEHKGSRRSTMIRNMVLHLASVFALWS